MTGPLDDEAIELLAWDSGFFGFPTARIRPSRLSAAALKALLDRAAGKGARLVYWAADPADAESERAGTACGGIQVDLKTVFRLGEKELADLAASAGTPPFPIRAAIESEPHAGLEALALRAGGHSRFRADPRFPPALFQALYAEWMRKSLSGEMADAVLLAEDGGRAAGIVTVYSRPGTTGSAASRPVGHVGLLAVAPEAEGRGLGRALMAAAAAWAVERGCGEARVVTQEANAAACALYGKCGYRVESRERVYHFWPGA